MSAVLPAARKGDRIAHGSSVSNHDAALLGVAVGALVGAPGSGGVTTAAVGAGVGSGGAASVSVGDVMPTSTSGVVKDAAPRTFLGPSSLPAALADAQPIDCHHHRDKPIRMGSATVIAEGNRMARASDETHCGAVLCDGDATVLVGGPPADGAPRSARGPGPRRGARGRGREHGARGGHGGRDGGRAVGRDARRRGDRRGGRGRAGRRAGGGDRSAPR